MNNPTSEQEHELTIVRTFDAPPEMVWTAYTESDWLLRWHSPKDCSATHAQMEAKPGGSWRIGMLSPEGSEFFMRGTVKEVAKPHRLVLTQEWEHMEGHGLPLGLTTLVIELEAEGKGTRMVFRHQGLLSEESKAEHEQGWNGAFDNLATCLRKASGS